MTVNPRSIVFVSATGGFGGPTRSLATVMATLTEEHRLLVGPANGSFTAAVRDRGLAADLFVAERRGPRDRSYQARAAVNVGRALRRAPPPAVVHANGVIELVTAAAACRVTGTPIVAWCHASSLTARRARAMRVAVRLTRPTLIAVSPVAVTALAAAGVDPATVEIVPNPVDPADVVAHQRRPAERTRVAYIGPPTLAKGFDTFRAMTQHAGPGLELVAYVPANRTTDATVVAAARSGARIEPWRSDVREVYAEVDVLVCPSRAESFSRLAAEAMLNGVPVVASDIAAHQATLATPDGSAGLFFPVGDARAALAAVDKTLVGDTAAELGRRGRRRAAAFAPTEVVASLRRLYAEAGSAPLR